MTIDLYANTGRKRCRAVHIYVMKYLRCGWQRWRAWAPQRCGRRPPTHPPTSPQVAASSHPRASDFNLPPFTDHNDFTYVSTQAAFHSVVNLSKSTVVLKRSILFPSLHIIRFPQRTAYHQRFTNFLTWTYPPDAGTSHIAITELTWSTRLANTNINQLQITALAAFLSNTVNHDLATQYSTRGQRPAGNCSSSQTHTISS